jgi:hypothetical protein
MSVDAAELFAQIEATLLIAIAVEIKGIYKDKRAMRSALWNLFGVAAALFALATSLASVAANRPLPTGGAWIVAGLTAVAAFSLMGNAMDRFDEVHGVGTRATNVVAGIFAVGFLVFLTWLSSFLSE